jgi:hypothetical protein
VEYKLNRYTISNVSLTFDGLSPLSFSSSSSSDTYNEMLQEVLLMLLSPNKTVLVMERLIPSKNRLGGFLIDQCKEVLLYRGFTVYSKYDINDYVIRKHVFGSRLQVVSIIKTHFVKICLCN